MELPAAVGYVVVGQAVVENEEAELGREVGEECETQGWCESFGGRGEWRGA